jgi:hypothetical protein
VAAGEGELSPFCVVCVGELQPVNASENAAVAPKTENRGEKRFMKTL